nr:hypothetical protein CFP56_51617 [Quercus suber]
MRCTGRERGEALPALKGGERSPKRRGGEASPARRKEKRRQCKEIKASLMLRSLRFVFIGDGSSVADAEKLKRR